MATAHRKPALRLPMRVWDLPTRLFHWMIVLLIATSYLAVSLNLMRLHFVSGYTVLALLIFRLVWGFTGSETARFGKFLRNPIAGLSHLANFRRREPDDQVGHNEAGGWMVLLMLGLLATQVATGLFSNDDGSAYGPLSKLVDKATSNRFSGIHALLFKVLLGAIVLHIAAIIAYAVIKRHNLVRPMLTGKKLLPAATRAPRMAPTALAAGVLALAAVAVVLVLGLP